VLSACVLHLCFMYVFCVVSVCMGALIFHESVSVIPILSEISLRVVITQVYFIKD